MTTRRDRDLDLDLDDLARRAADGDRESLSALVRELQHPMYRLALRFLGHRQDAQDATQEILIRVMTHLGSFEGRPKFTTWAYTVATRSLLRTKRRFVESSVQGPEQFAAFLDAGLRPIRWAKPSGRRRGGGGALSKTRFPDEHRVGRCVARAEVTSGGRHIAQPDAHQQGADGRATAPVAVRPEP